MVNPPQKKACRRRVVGVSRWHVPGVDGNVADPRGSGSGRNPGNSSLMGSVNGNLDIWEYSIWEQQLS